MNKNTNYKKLKFLLQEVLPVLASGIIIVSVIWIVLVSLQEEPAHSPTPDHTITNNQIPEGGDDS